MGMCESKQEYVGPGYLNSDSNEELQFTRYLYEKDEVKLSLVISIINKKDDAIFWAYELFYSGFKIELAELLWKIYFDFYATLNPSFEKYLKIKLADNFGNISDGEKLISMIINNFIIRPHNMDVFMLRQISNTCDFDKQFITGYKLTSKFDIICKEILLALETEDYLTLSSLICNDILDKHLILALEKIIGFFSKLGLKFNNPKIIKEYKKNVDNTTHTFKRIILLAKTLYYFTLIKQIPLGKNLYVHIEPEEIITYKTICADLKEKGGGTRVAILPAYKILPLAAVHDIDKDNYLSLFKLKRDNIDIKNAYYYQWLYHASFSPIWKERIEKFHGYIDKTNKTVIFDEIEDSDDNLQAFHDEFGYEPDEQKMVIQIRTIQEIKNIRNWSTFYRDHKNVGVVEIEEEILNVFDKIVY
jgi:hypothetical protein